MLEVLAAVGELTTLDYDFTELEVAKEHLAEDQQFLLCAIFRAVKGEGLRGGLIVKEVLEKSAFRDKLGFTDCIPNCLKVVAFHLFTAGQ